MLLEENRKAARVAINSSRELEAIAILSENICAIYGGNPNASLHEDSIAFQQALETASAARLQERISADISYAIRILEGDDLEAEELDLACSLVAGALLKGIATKIAANHRVMTKSQMYLVRDKVLASPPLAISERRISRSNPLYIKIEALSDLIQETQSVIQSSRDI